MIIRRKGKKLHILLPTLCALIKTVSAFAPIKRTIALTTVLQESKIDKENDKKYAISSPKNSKDFECLDGEICHIDHDLNQPEPLFYLNSIPVAETETPWFNPIMALPIITPILAYLTYDDVAKLFDVLVKALNQDKTWIAVDGGAYQAKIIAPAINGIVVPTISILFATLTSNTVTTLRTRQIDTHTYLNCEAGDLRLLSSMVDSFPESTSKTMCLEYLKQYTCRLIAESHDESVTARSSFGSTDSEMNGFIATLNALAREATRGDGHVGPPPAILSESYAAVVRLNSSRSSRITTLQSTYPILHYAILAILAASICTAFLLETNQELLIFLNAIQLRILWTMLIGSFTALGVVCYDLSGPFRGSYRVSNAVDQLQTIRDMLKVVTGDE
jgi:hypothetical protein